MEKLNIAATILFAKIMDKMWPASVIELLCDSPTEPRFIISKRNLQFTAEVFVQVYTLSQFIMVNDEGKFMPQVSFFVRDQRRYAEDYEHLILRPFCYIDDRTGYFVECIDFSDDKYDAVPAIYDDCIEMSQVWLSHLETVGFLH